VSLRSRCIAFLTFLSVIIFIIEGSQIVTALSDKYRAEKRNYSSLLEPASYLPVAFGKPSPLPVPIIITSTHPIDFESARILVQTSGLELVNNKIGFHFSEGGNAQGLGDWYTSLDAAGAPIFLVSVDSAGDIPSIQTLAASSQVPHTLVYRLSTAGQNDGYDYDVPDYNLPPAEAASIHWSRHLSKFPQELDPNVVWFETVNEIDKNRSEWLGQFALETASLTLASGYRWAAFGWSSGEPEPEHWTTPSMLEFLRLVGNNPNELAISLHEYSYDVDSIGDEYPFRVGRFQKLFEICDSHGIKRPTVLITEWGWTQDHIPSVAQAIEDINWASWLYSAYPQVTGAAIWHLGFWHNDISTKVQQLIAPLSEYSLRTYFKIVPGTGTIDSSLFHPSTDDLESLELSPIEQDIAPK